jgi:hypothetical protein
MSTGGNLNRQFLIVATVGIASLATLLYIFKRKSRKEDLDKKVVQSKNSMAELTAEPSKPQLLKDQVESVSFFPTLCI